MTTEEFVKEAQRLARQLQDACWKRTQEAVERAMGVTHG